MLKYIKEFFKEVAQGELDYSKVKPKKDKDDISNFCIKDGNVYENLGSLENIINSKVFDYYNIKELKYKIERLESENADLTSRNEGYRKIITNTHLEWKENKIRVQNEKLKEEKADLQRQIQLLKDEIQEIKKQLF